MVAIGGVWGESCALGVPLVGLEVVCLAECGGVEVSAAGEAFFAVAVVCAVVSAAVGAWIWVLCGRYVVIVSGCSGADVVWVL